MDKGKLFFVGEIYLFFIIVFWGFKKIFWVLLEINRMVGKIFVKYWRFEGCFKKRESFEKLGKFLD